MALAVRALPLPTVATGDRVTFIGMDAYYHMRRIHYALVRFPETLDFDPYINYPDGARAIWPAFFDTASALLVMPFYAAGGLEAAERALVWLPAILGAATVVVVYFLALRFFGYATALLSALLLAVLPAHYWYSQLGFLDHHAAVALASSGLLYAAMVFTQNLSSSEKGAPAPTVLALGACLALNLLLWPGSLLHVAVIEAGLCVFLLSRKTAPEFQSVARALAGVQAFGLALLLPFTLGQEWARWSLFSPTVLSEFQPWLFATLLIFFVLCMALSRLGWGPSGRPHPIPAVVIGLTLLAASFAAIGGLREGALEAWQWLARDEVFQASVLESKPLFEVNGEFSTRIAEGRLSRFIYVLPFALLFLAFASRRRTDRASCWILLAYTLSLAITTVLQRRFFNSFSVPLAITMAWTGVTAYRYLAAKSSRRVERIGWAAVLASLALYLLLPIEAPYRRDVHNLKNYFENRPGRLLTVLEHLPALRETAAWIRENTPATEGFFDASKRPAYGVLTLPGIGHLFEYEARRPVVSDNFGDDIGAENYSETRRYLATRNEAEAEAILSQLGVRYVVATPPHSVAPKQAAPRMLYRLAYLDGDGLAGHRLVFEASRLGFAVRDKKPAPKVYERVPGARVLGTAPPGETVFARVGLHTNRGRRLVYRQKTATGLDGRYELRLPYANDAPSGAIATEPQWLIESGGETQSLVLPESAVVSGATVSGPDFGP